MNKKVVVIIVIIICIFLLYYASKLNTENNTNNNVVSNNINDTVINNMENNTNDKSSEVYYEDDKTINKYISLFNTMYPNNKITSDMLSVYYHHGSEHKDQVNFTMADFLVTLSSSYFNKASIFIQNLKDNDVEIKSLIKDFTKVFNSSITSEEIDEYINSQEGGSSMNTYDGIEFLINKNVNGTKIEYIKITGQLQ